MRKISERTRKAVITSYLNGMTYDAISTAHRVSKGTVANIIEELRAGLFPGLEDVSIQLEALRELSNDLRKLSIGPADAAAGLAVFRRLEESIRSRAVREAIAKPTWTGSFPARGIRTSL